MENIKAVKVDPIRDEIDREIIETLIKQEDSLRYFRDGKYKEYLADRKTVYGNIFDCKENIIVHQVNMYKVMGSGIAKQIKERFPNVYNQYLNHDGKLGEVQLVLASFKIDTSNFPPITPIKYVANMYSQNEYGYDGNRYTDYDAMRKGFRELVYYVSKSNECGNHMSLAIPHSIGCGLGGGDWTEVSRIIVEELKDVNYKIYKLN